jgi:thioredoxin 1
MAQGHHIKEVTSSEWQVEVEKSNLPVFVDFWAPGCDSCKKVVPILEDLAVRYSGKVKFVKVNADENDDLASKYNVFGKPTLAIFNKGNVISQQIGVPVNAEESLANLIEKVLKKA